LADGLGALVSLPKTAMARIALLEAVGELGSISAAARRVGLSYKGAWDAVQALNNLFDGPLVTAAPGGRTGGAATLTPRGRAVMDAVRRVQAELDMALAKLDQGLGSDVFWSLGMKTSARNALRGVISGISPGAVSGEVTLSLGDGLAITAILTRRSIDELGLSALIKASFVILAKGENLRTSARNQIAGVVAYREDGAVNSEITLDIGGGKTLVATVTLESARSLDLNVGDTVTALIKAPHVILAVE
jgi:molybdate transport system regulatory protein